MWSHTPITIGISQRIIGKCSPGMVVETHVLGLHVERKVLPVAVSVPIEITGLTAIGCARGLTSFEPSFSSRLAYPGFIR